jgi:hypothetical protein
MLLRESVSPRDTTAGELIVGAAPLLALCRDFSDNATTQLADVAVKFGIAAIQLLVPENVRGQGPRASVRLRTIIL